MKVEIIQTADGGHSLYVPELEEHYHSVHGAIQEAKHVFIQAGYKQLAAADQVKILEIGYGTALNCLLTYLESIKDNQKVFYHGLELHPLAPEIISKLNYPTQLGEGQKEFMQLLDAPWNIQHDVSRNFILFKDERSVFDFKPANVYDLIYFDAFGYRAQEEMWSLEVFKKMYAALIPGGLLVTYSSKGLVRRTMQEAGFRVEKLAGPAGKREMVRAWK